MLACGQSNQQLDFICFFVHIWLAGADMDSQLPCTGTDTVAETVARIAADKSAVPGGLVPALHAVQEALGWIPPDAVPIIAGAFNRSRAEVHGVLSFYHDFRTTPPAQHQLRICRAEACQSMGADRVLAEAERILGCRMHERSADGAMSLEPVYCLGQCAVAPALTVADRLWVRVTPDRIAEILDQARQETL